MTVISGGPHILLFERDQQLTALLSGELGLAGYEVHTSRTAVEVFDAIARFPVRLVMVNLAQAQAGRREFWVALDAQRRGRGVQVFTFRCSNLGGYGPDDPEEHVQTVPTDLEVDGMLGIVKLVDAVRAHVPGPAAISSPPRPAPVESGQMPTSVSPAYHSVAPMAGLEENQMPTSVSPTYSQPQYNYHQPLPPEQPAPVSAPTHLPVTPPAPVKPVEPPRSGPSTFTDKIRAVIYPSNRNFSSVPETNWSPHTTAPTQQSAPYQTPDVQPRPQASQRFAEADYAPPMNQEEKIYQAPMNPQTADQPTYVPYNGSSPAGRGAYISDEESGLDQLSRLLRESQPSPAVNGYGPKNQHSTHHPAVVVEQQELQDLRVQLQQAARLDEAYGRANANQPKPGEAMGAGQLRASPIQDTPFEREMENRRAAGNGLQGYMPPSPGNPNRSILAFMQQTHAMPPVQPAPPAPGQMSESETRIFSSPAASQVHSLSPTREAVPGTPLVDALSSQSRPMQDVAAQSGIREGQVSGQLSLNEDDALAERVRANLQQTLSKRPEIRTSDDMLLDIVKSLPPMDPVPQPPQTQVLSGRATRSLGSVLLEGHLVPQERLQVAQHVQRMLRGVDLNYQLGEILLMFKLLSPDQLLAASLVSYGMISTIQITALGRIRQELHAIGLEYDLESLLVLFRILTPEQLREVRASWSS